MINLSQKNSLMCLSDVCQYLSVNCDTIQNWIKTRHLPALKKGPDWLFKKNEIDKWILKISPMIPKRGLPTKKVLSLFSGGGGLDLGFEGDFPVIEEAVNPKIHPDWYAAPKNGWIHLPATPFRTIFANDIDKYAARAWNKYFSQKRQIENIYHTLSIVDLVRREKSGEHLLPSDIDIVTGGFPCNDFSVAGKRNGFESHRLHDGSLRTSEATEESRGKLYMWMKQVVELVQPKVFYAENVKGLVSLADVKDIIENDFRHISGGYLVVPARVLYAPDYGIPQTRERVIFIGLKKSALIPRAMQELLCTPISPEYDPYPVSTHGEGINLLPYTTTKSAFKGLQEPDKSTDLSQQNYSHAKYMGSHCQGQKEVDLNAPGPTIRAEHHGNIEYRRLSPEHGGKHKVEFEYGLQERRLTIRECARIQTFPDDYEFVIPHLSPTQITWDSDYDGKGQYLTSTSGYRIIGNAVPPLLGYHLAKRLEEVWPKFFGEQL